MCVDTMMQGFKMVLHSSLPSQGLVEEADLFPGDPPRHI